MSSKAILWPSFKLAVSIHSCLVWASPPLTAPKQMLGMPMDNGMLLSVEPGPSLGFLPVCL